MFFWIFFCVVVASLSLENLLLIQNETPYTLSLDYSGVERFHGEIIGELPNPVLSFSTANIQTTSTDYVDIQLQYQAYFGSKTNQNNRVYVPEKNRAQPWNYEGHFTLRMKVYENDLNGTLELYSTMSVSSVDEHLDPLLLEWYGKLRHKEDPPCTAQDTNWKVNILLPGQLSCALLRVKPNPNLKSPSVITTTTDQKTREQLSSIRDCRFTTSESFETTQLFYGWTRTYPHPFNCINWALQNLTLWINPPNTEKEAIEQFEKYNYKRADCNAEEVKAALYCHKINNMCKKPPGERYLYQHAALKLPNEKWSSKFGEWVLLQHEKKEDVSGSTCGYSYGEPGLCFTGGPDLEFELFMFHV